MNSHFSQTRKIDPTRGTFLGDGTPNDMDRVEIGPTQLAFAEWAQDGLDLPNLAAMRSFRHRRLTDHIVARGYAGLLMFDPLNIRYATDSTNMQLWNTHNPFRATLLCADGYMVMWDYKNSPFLSEFNPLVQEQRAGADLFYFDRGDKVDVAADVFANEVRILLQEHAPGLTQLGVDKVMLHGLRALEAQGLTIMDGEEVTEKSRSVKGPDEILAMRCSSHACETAVRLMEDFARTHVGDGVTCENDIWA
ncbi:MAG: aminopeptidase P family protein, partial [Roseobacter sp.]